MKLHKLRLEIWSSFAIHSAPSLEIALALPSVRTILLISSSENVLDIVFSDVRISKTAFIWSSLSFFSFKVSPWKYLPWAPKFLNPPLLAPKILNCVYGMTSNEAKYSLPFSSNLAEIVMSLRERDWYPETLRMMTLVGHVIHAQNGQSEFCNWTFVQCVKVRLLPASLQSFFACPGTWQRKQCPR